MPRIYRQNCKICNEYYEGVGSIYCSRECYKRDKDMMELSAKNRREGIRNSDKCKAHIQMLIESRRGTKHSEETKEKMRKKAIGRRHTEKTKHKLSELNKRKWASGIITVDDIKNWIKAGRDATRGKPNTKCSGEKSHLWRGGISEENNRIRSSLEYRIWRRAVFERDNYTCQKCGKRGGDLEADHIKQFAYYPKLRFDIDNGQTLCKKCHKEKTIQDMINSQVER